METSQKLMCIGEDQMDSDLIELWYKKENFVVIPEKVD